MEREPDGSGGAPGESKGSPRTAGNPVLLPVASAAYVILFFAAWGWIRLRGDSLVIGGSWGAGPEAGLGVGIGILIALASVALSRLFRIARALETEFGRILGGLSPGEILLLAALSGIVEEVVFRAALQPKLGLVLTSLLFGLLHVGPGRIYLLWTFFAVGMGFLLGVLFEVTGGLAAPVALHFAVNAINLARLTRGKAVGIDSKLRS